MENCGKRSRPQNPQNALQAMNATQLRQAIKSIKSDYPSLSKLKRQELCEVLTKLKKGRTSSSRKMTKTSFASIKNRGFLVNNNNSCYIDSVIVALLHRDDNGWVTQNLIKKDPSKAFKHPALKAISKQVWESIKQIKTNLTTSSKQMTCTTLRRLFHAFDKEYANHFNTEFDTEWLHQQSDPMDVLFILTRIFSIEPDVTRTYQVVETRTEKVMFNSPIIPYDMLLRGEPIKLDDIVPYNVTRQGSFLIRKK